MESIGRQVLISYHESDRDLVHRLYEDLIKRGIKVWLDSHDIQIGQSIRQAIYQGIVNSNFFIACLSPKYLENEFCRTQLFLARAFNKQILPVIIGEFTLDHDPTAYLLETGQKHTHAIKGLEDLYTLDFTGYYAPWGHGSYEKNFEVLVNAIQPVPKPSPINAELFYISYNWHDRKFVDRLSRDLELARGQIWIDRLSVQSGKNWREAMYAGLRSAHSFILCLSPEALDSENVMHEMLIARMRGLPIYPVISERVYDKSLMAELETMLERSTDMKFLLDIKWLVPDPDYQSLLTSLKKLTGLIEPEGLRRQGIFISYRRADSQATTGRIHEKLVERFGAETVFMDVDNIPPGEDFTEYYKNWLKDKAAIVLVIIGKNWATIKSEDNENELPRLHKKDDPVRIEVETALAMNDLKVIPVLIDDVDIPNKEDLPESLHRLFQLNASKVRHDPDFRVDIDRLITAIENSQQL